MTGDKLRALLKYNNINIKELADKMGISRQCLDSRLNIKSVKLELLEQIESCIGYKLIRPEFDENEKNTDQENILLAIQKLQEKTFAAIERNAEQFNLLKQAKVQNKSLRKELERLLEEEKAVSVENDNIAI